MHIGKGNIVWLASYPKSGNTWFRVLLSNFYNESNTPVDINNLYPTPIASDRQQLDTECGVYTSDLNHDEILALRARLYTKQSDEANNIIFRKVHDAWKAYAGKPILFPASASRAIVYIIRHPFDVCVSMAAHFNLTLDKAVKAINNPNFTLSGQQNNLSDQLMQHISTWNHHVNSWTNQQLTPCIVIRYEDMLDNCTAVLTSVLNFLSISYTHKKIEKAIKFSNFDTLQQQEKTTGFKEKSLKSKIFFRSGKAGEGEKQLNDKQKTEILRVHGENMKKYGYG